MKTLIIITRIHASSNSRDDEFTLLWGQNQFVERVDHNLGDFALRVINGPYFYSGEGKPVSWSGKKVSRDAETYVSCIKSHMDELENCDELMILYHVNLNDFKTELEKLFPEAICEEYSSSQKRFYEGIYEPLAESVKKGEFDVELFNELWNHFDLMPQYVRLYKHIVLERLKGNRDENVTAKITDPPELKSAYQSLPEDVKKDGANGILDYLSNKVVQEGT